MREGSLEAPTRHTIKWRDADFWDAKSLEKELERAFDICHGCRRCFNLCDSFPRLFDMIDDSESGELDSVDKSEYGKVVEACTLCDMCFLTKCPYVPPHEWNLDFPHLMLRARAQAFKNGDVNGWELKLTETDKNGKLGCNFSSIANWASKEGSPVRGLMESVAGIDKNAALPEFSKQTCQQRAKSEPVTVNAVAPAAARKAVIYASCFGEYNSTDIVMDTRTVLAKNGINAEIVYPECCGMPQLEHGEIERVAEKARTISANLKSYVDDGYDIVVPISSCALMLKAEWPLIEPDDANVKALSQATYDVSEYLVDIAKKEGLAEGLSPLDGDVTVHISCHSRAQNMGQKGAELLRLIPETEVKVLERCSGHGGSWGVMKENFEVGMKVGKNAFRTAAKNATPYVVSECPLAREQILQGITREDADNVALKGSTEQHPIQLIRKAYGE